MFINEPLTKAAQDGLDARPMAHTISSFFQCCHVHFDSGTRQLIKVKRGVPRTLRQPEEKITQHALVDVDGSRTLPGETGFAIRTDPDTIVRPLRTRYQVGSLRHCSSFSRPILSGTSFCASFCSASSSPTGNSSVRADQR